MAALYCRDRWKVLRVCAVVFVLGLVIYQLMLHMSKPRTATTDVFVDCETNFTSKEGAVFIPEESVLTKLRHFDLVCLYHRYVTNIQTVCHRKERLGGLDHGGWDICVDSDNPLKPSCLVYSLGINFNFLFDDSIASKYLCEVHSFDPSMGLEEHDHAARVHFHPVAISNVTKINRKGRKHITLEGARTILDHEQRTIDVMKMDVGGVEWPVLDYVAQTAGIVSQIVVELHDFKLINGEKKEDHSSRSDYVAKLDVLRKLHDAGFRIFHSEPDLACRFRSVYGPDWSNCYKVSMVKHQETKTNGFLSGWLN